MEKMLNVIGWCLLIGLSLGAIVFYNLRAKSYNQFVEQRKPKCNSCKHGFDGSNGNGYQPCNCKKHN